MKTLARLLMLLTLTSALGCVTLPVSPWQSSEPDAPPAIRDQTPPAPPPVVLPEQVTAASTQETLNALKAELDYDSKYGKK